MQTPQTVFTLKVLEIVRNIPRGETLSYKEVAALAGNPKAARAVGTIMAHNYRPDVPCHRVICTNGKLGEYNRGKEKKQQMLEEEALTDPE